MTVAGVTHRLPPPFFVLATQNPIEMEGTYPLPEAQLDRFLFKLRVPVPGARAAERDHRCAPPRCSDPYRAAAVMTGQRDARRPVSSSAKCRSRHTSGSSRPRW